MEISYKNTFWDYWQFNWYLILNSKLSLIILVPLLLILGELARDVWSATNEYSFLVKAIVLSVLCSAGLGVFLLLAIVVVSTGAFLAYRGRNAKMDEGKIQITESGLVTEALVGRSELQWSAVKAIKQNKRFIFIFFSAYLACIVPKRAFAQETDANRFYDYAKELWEKNKH